MAPRPLGRARHRPVSSSAPHPSLSSSAYLLASTRVNCMRVWQSSSGYVQHVVCTHIRGRLEAVAAPCPLMLERACGFATRGGPGSPVVDGGPQTTNPREGHFGRCCRDGKPKSGSVMVRLDPSLTAPLRTPPPPVSPHSGYRALTPVYRRLQCSRSTGGLEGVWGNPAGIDFYHATTRVTVLYT